MMGIWPKGFKNRKNVTFLFRLDLKETKEYKLSLNCANTYKVYSDDKFVAFGPNRCAHGYNRTMVLNLESRYITVEAYQLNVKTFNFLKEDPFFKAEVNAIDGTNYKESDFECFYPKERVEKVSRYSFQRGFEEIYDISLDRYSFYKGMNIYEKIETEPVKGLIQMESYTNLPTLEIDSESKLLEEGYVDFDKTKSGAYGRYNKSESILNGTIEGFTLEEVTDSVIPECMQMVKVKDGNLKYSIRKFERSITGFSKLKVNCKKKGSFYLIFDEIVKENENGLSIDFLRNTTTNCFKWNVNEPGEYVLDSFEPYTFNCFMICCDKENDASLSIVKFENPDTNNMYFKSEDEDLNMIFDAIKATFSQNAVDLLTDCPSRERSGWLSDSYFSSVAEKCLTGDNLVEKAFLENYSLFSTRLIPKAMFPMNYPSDEYDSTYIPNWSMWYVLELVKYAKIHKDSDIIEKSKKKVVDLLEFFEKYENEFGLLENLESWVFVEWSKANDYSHIRGVNIPSNMCYQKVLLEAYKLYGVEKWLEKSTKIKEYIKKEAFDGSFFVDNLVRDENNILVKTDNYTEVCQYYAFWFECIDEYEFENTYKVLMNELGPNRKGEKFDYIEKPNVMYGIYMRLDLLMRDERPDVLLNEVRSYFLNMAKTTGTLWENTFDSCSLNHAFASYSLKWLVFSLTGYDIEKGCLNASLIPVKINTEVKIPLDIKSSHYIKLVNSNGNVKMEEA